MGEIGPIIKIAQEMKKNHLLNSGEALKKAAIPHDHSATAFHFLISTRGASLLALDDAACARGAASDAACLLIVGCDSRVQRWRMLLEAGHRFFTFPARTPTAPCCRSAAALLRLGRFHELSAPPRRTACQIVCSHCRLLA
jgi:hypothetical protein